MTPIFRRALYLALFVPLLLAALALTAQPTGDINKQFLDPKLDVNKWEGRFSRENREAFAQREAILNAINLRAGQDIADVGAGTGIFLEPISKRIAPAGRKAPGKLYAVDISPKFVSFLQSFIANKKLKHTSVIQGSVRSTNLKANSVDLIFTCDTYHHFVDYNAMLKDFRRVLRSGGRLVIVDFERIESGPRKTKDWLLNHVRADKETVTSEIKAAGFRFLGEVTPPQLTENYILVFQK